MGFWNEDRGIFGGVIGNHGIRVKYIFLAFLQGYFTNHPRYTWLQNNLASSKIQVLDKFSFNLETAGKKPAIILSRGPMRWLNLSIKQRQTHDLMTGQEVYADLLEGTISLTCIAKEGIIAEELATIVFNLLTAHKNMLLREGLHQIHNISISEEQALRVDSEPNIAAVTVQIQYSMNAELTMVPAFYNISVVKVATYVAPVVDGETDTLGEILPAGQLLLEGPISTTLFENNNFIITSGGERIRFTIAPENYLSIVSGVQVVASGISDGSTPRPQYGSLIEGQPVYNLTYLSAISLGTVTQNVRGNSTTREFVLSEPVYGYGPLLKEVIISSSGMRTDPDTWEEETNYTIPWVKINDE